MNLKEKFLADIKSAKYQMFFIATLALFVGKLNGWEWIAAAGIFTGANMVKHHMIGDYANGKNNYTEDK